MRGTQIQRYHLQEWRGSGNAPTTSKEFFNMKHSSARNVIEWAFGLLKGRWVILYGKLYYPVQVQCRTIMACCLLYHLINREMINTCWTMTTRVTQTMQRLEVTTSTTLRRQTNGLNEGMTSHSRCSTNGSHETPNTSLLPIGETHEKHVLLYRSCCT